MPRFRHSPGPLTVENPVPLLLLTGRARRSIFGVFTDGTELMDAYSGVSGTVRDGRISLTTAFGLVLLSERR